MLEGPLLGFELCVDVPLLVWGFPTCGNWSCELPRNLSIDGLTLLVRTLSGLRGTVTQRVGTVVPELDRGLNIGFEVEGGEVVVGEIDILDWEGSSVAFFAVDGGDGARSCSVVVSMVTRVARERKSRGGSKEQQAERASDTTICF